MSVEGVDYTTPERPSVAALVAAGKVFACRYGGPGGAWKHLDLTEVRQLTAAGIAIVANAEGTADGLLGGRSAGVAWATSAADHFRLLGMPADRPIYFSVDFDTTSGDWATLDAAFDGIASVIGRARTGVYGEYSIVRHLAGNGRARWFWQTYAWSSGQWYAGNHIEQYRNGVSLGGGTVDLNRANQADYGQWGVDDMSAEADKQIRDLHYAMFTNDLPTRPVGSQSRDAKSTLAMVAEIQAEQKVLAEKVDQILVVLEELAEKVGPLPATVTILGGELQLGSAE
ncbi:glycoside hydrolase domain-containing protein [Hamadaea sp. NPDC051192]|uniref:glycoside hydrolase domain-containing protein n=1 Tax=Hamadaea sp. NPDC051192 TaxID=3154940 RepID=UPI00341ADDC1